MSSFTQSTKFSSASWVIFSVIFLFSSSIQAEPILQIYLEGGTYDTVSESWVLTPPGSSSGVPFRLWAIGNVDGNGGKGLIENVRLSAAYDAAAGPISISLTPSTTGGFGGTIDPTTPFGTGTLLQTVTDGSTPLLGDGSSLPTHGIYGSGINWQEFSLGDFTDSDSSLGDFIGGFPSNLTLGAQINVYEISVTNSNTDPTLVHFDLYNHIVAGNHAKYKFAPFSHDGDGTVTVVPEPSSFVLAGLGCFGLFGYGAHRRRNKHNAVDVSTV